MNRNKIRELMFYKEMSQDALEKLTGIDQSEISKIINDKKPGLQLRTAQKIAKALDSTVDYIWPYEWWLDK